MVFCCENDIFFYLTSKKYFQWFYINKLQFNFVIEREESMLAVNNINEKYNQKKVSFRAFRIKDTDAVVNNFIGMPKDQVILKLEESLKLSDDSNVFKKVLKNLSENPISTVINACKEGFGIKLNDFEGDFELPKKMRNLLKSMGDDDKNDNFLKQFIKGIESGTDDISEEAHRTETKSLKDANLINAHGIKTEFSSLAKKEVNTDEEIKETKTKFKPKSIEELAAEGSAKLSKKTKNREPDKIKSGIDTKRKETSIKIKTIKNEIKEKTAIINKYWSKLNKAKVLSSQDGSLSEMQELSLQKESAMMQINVLEKELQDLLGDERKLK